MTARDELEPRRTPAAGAATGPTRPAHERVDWAETAAQRCLAEADLAEAARLLAAAYRDELTGALNRGPGRELLANAVSTAHQTSTPLAIIVFDVDGLKRVNDVTGHRRGDELLAATGTALRAALRSDDVIVRYGGDEFVCALPGTSAATAAVSIARVREALDLLVPGATVSAGYAEVDPDDSLDDAVSRADSALYRRRLRARTGAPSVACGACGARIELAEFVLVGTTDRITRAADCPGCGETTLIQLARSTD